MAATNFKSKNLEQMKLVLGQLEKKSLKVGFLESAHYPDGTPVAYVASIQEFGHGSTPPRPFMRPAQEQNKDKWNNNFARAVKAAINGVMDLDQGLEQVGMVAAGDVRKAIKAVTAPPLSILTLLIRKHKKGGGTVNGREVGRLAGERDFEGPRPKKDKTMNLSGVSTKPLVDDGIMIQSVTSVVENR